MNLTEVKEVENDLKLFYKGTSILISGGNGVRSFDGLCVMK
jgi:hypothetical protein